MQNRTLRNQALIAGSALILGLALGLGLVSSAGAEESAKPLLVKIHADWCGTCTKLNATWDQLKSQHGDAVRFVILDVTDKGTTEAARSEARRLGIETVFDTYKSKTGTIAVVNGSGEAVVVLKGQVDPAAYDPAIQKARAS